MGRSLVFLTVVVYMGFSVAGLILSLVVTDGTWDVRSPLAKIAWLFRFWPFPMMESLRVPPDSYGLWTAAYGAGLAVVAAWARVVETFVRPELRETAKARTVALLGAFFALMILQIAAILTFRQE